MCVCKLKSHGNSMSLGSKTDALSRECMQKVGPMAHHFETFCILR